MAVHHARSNSFPSRAHPLIAEFNQQLSRLKSSQEASSSASIACKLSGLEDLHDCVDQLLSLPQNHKALSKEENQKQVGEILDGSLRILEIFSAFGDALSQLKESVQELQSILRRRRSDKLDLTNEVKKFLASKKAIRKTMKGFKINPMNKNEKNDEVFSLLKEVESTTLAVLESLFSFVSTPKSSSWSMVSKLVSSKRIVSEEVNEFEIGVAALQSLLSCKTKTSDTKLEETAQNELRKMGSCIQDLEEGIESLYRRMIKSRVSLLNISLVTSFEIRKFILHNLSQFRSWSNTM